MKTTSASPGAGRFLASSRFAAWGVLVLALLCTVLTWQAARKQVRGNDRARFAAETDRILWTVTDRLLRCEDLLKSGQGLFSASKSVERDEWRRFVERLDLENRFGGLSSLSFIAHVPQGDLDEFLQTTRVDGAPGFVLHPAGQRTTYSILKFAEPPPPSASIFGFDFATLDEARAAQDAACETGLPTLSGPQRLIHESELIVVMYLPVFGNGQPTSTPLERNAALTGWIAAPIRLENFINSSVEATEGIQFEIYDGETRAAERLLFRSGGPNGQSDDGRTPSFSHASLLDVGGRVWKLHFKSLPAFDRQSDHTLPLAALLLGLVCSGFFFHLTWTVRSTRTRAQEMARKITADLRETEERLQLAVTSANLGLWNWDISTNEIYLSPIWKRQLGYADHELESTFEVWKDFLHPDDRDMAVAKILAYLENPWPDYEIEFRLRHKDGSYRWILCKADVQVGGDGRTRRMMGAHIDITERKLDEEKLRESQEQLQITFEQAAVGIAHVAPDGRWLRVNSRLCQIVGYSPDELVEKRLVDITHPEDLQADIDHFIRILSGEAQDYTLEQRYLHKSGATVWIELTVSLVRNAAGQPKYFISVVEDISERKRAEAALLESESRAQRAHAEAEALLSTISAVLIGVDTNGRIARWNFAAERAFGVPAAFALGAPLDGCGLSWSQEAVQGAIADCLKLGQPVELTNLSYRRPDGKDAWLHLTLTPSLSSGDDGLNFVLLGIDTTQRRLLEDQLRQAQKLESIGQLAAGIAHEINTPIQFIGDNLRFLQDGFGDLRKALDQLPPLLECAGRSDGHSQSVAQSKAAIAAADLDYLVEEIPKAIEQSLDGTTRVAKIVQAMKDFSHPDGDEKKPVNLNRSIEATVTVARNEWKYVANLVTDLDPDLPPVPCRQGELNQVILNLTVNAAHAIADTPTVKQGGKGTITVSTRRDGSWVEIRVADTGTGIPEKARDKIFDPFFTTKPVGKGTGQGLFITHAVIVEKHSGTIAFETETGRGTTFVIRLPLEPPSRAATQKAA